MKYTTSHPQRIDLKIEISSHRQSTDVEIETQSDDDKKLLHSQYKHHHHKIENTISQILIKSGFESEDLVCLLQSIHIHSINTHVVGIHSQALYILLEFKNKKGREDKSDGCGLVGQNGEEE